MRSLSGEAIILLLVWLVAVVASVVATARSWDAVRGGTDTKASMWLSLAAIVPGAGLLLEYLARLFYADWTRSPPIAPHDLAMVVPAAIWVLAGPILFVVSAVLWPLKSSPRRMLLVRAGHVLAWAFSAWATVLSLASV